MGAGEKEQESVSLGCFRGRRRRRWAFIVEIGRFASTKCHVWYKRKRIIAQYIIVRLRSNKTERKKIPSSSNSMFTRPHTHTHTHTHTFFRRLLVYSPGRIRRLRRGFIFKSPPPAAPPPATACDSVAGRDPPTKPLPLLLLPPLCRRLLVCL